MSAGLWWRCRVSYRHLSGCITQSTKFYRSYKGLHVGLRRDVWVLKETGGYPKLGPNILES